MHVNWQFSGSFPYLYAMLYAKMFHGYDIRKHWLAPKMLTLCIARTSSALLSLNRIFDH